MASAVLWNLTFADWLQIAIGAAGLLVSAIAAAFGWRIWVRGRRLYDIEFATQRRYRKPIRAYLVLVIDRPHGWSRASVGGAL